VAALARQFAESGWESTASNWSPWAWVSAGLCHAPLGPALSAPHRRAGGLRRAVSEVGA
jgi:hypothetical protein